MKYDLHVHSTYSDGIKSMNELGKEAKAAGLAGFAITDHDTIAGWSEINAINRESGVVVFPGVEVSTEWEKRDVHILGYAIQNSANLREKLIFLAESRVKRIESVIAKFTAMGIKITMAEVMAKAGEGTIGRPHVASVLAEKGYVKDRQDAFDRYLNRGKPAYVERVKFSPFEAVKMIKSCGGYAVLAHPGLDNASLLIDDLVQTGLDGIEAYHSSHTAEASARFEALAKRYNLFVTAGSDYHGHSDTLYGGIGSLGLDEKRLPEIFHQYLNL